MDIQEILDQKIKKLPSGPHLDGLRAVKSHIDAAGRHLQRGQQDPDETLFTDVIFRCNQAFEGSIKEAYRVLAGKDPERTTPAEIEQFLASSNLLRKKVLDQFTTYRKEWRNPSTHDYTLDFDEDEALVALVSVTVFAIVLCDQIDSKLAFDSAAAGTAGLISGAEQKGPLLDLVTSKTLSFATSYTDDIDPAEQSSRDYYYKLEGALAGYLSAELASVPDLTVAQSKRFAGREADVVVARGSEKVVIELKSARSKNIAQVLTNSAISQASLFLHEPDVVGAVALIYLINGRDYEATHPTGALSNRLRIVMPRPLKT